RPGYAELHCHSAYSFLDGASLPEELALRAAELGYPALALTDHDGVWGAMEHAQACSALGVRPIVGAELAVRPPPSPGRAEREPGAGAGVPGRGRGEPAGTGSGAAGAAPLHVTLLVESRAGWRNLCRLITEAHAGTRWPGEGGPRASPTAPSLPLAALAERAEGLVCLSGCAGAGALVRGGEQVGRSLLAAFGRERFRVELQRPLWRHDRARNRALAHLAERLGVPCVATGDAHFHHPRRAQLQDALVAVRHGITLDEGAPLRRPPGGPRRERRARGAPPLRPHPRPRLPLPGRRGRGGGQGPGGDLPQPPRASLPGAAGAPRGRAPPGGGAPRHPLARPLRVLPAPLRHPRARPRGRGRGARPGLRPRPPPARPRPRLQRQLDRLLPDRPLAR